MEQEEIRGDTVRALRAVFADNRLMVRAAECLPGYDRPALVVWARSDRVMPPEHGRRLADLLPRGRLVEVEDVTRWSPWTSRRAWRSSFENS